MFWLDWLSLLCHHQSPNNKSLSSTLLGRKEPERQVWRQQRQAFTQHFQIFRLIKRMGWIWFLAAHHSHVSLCGSHWTLAKVKILLDLLFCCFFLPSWISAQTAELEHNTSIVSFTPAGCILWDHRLQVTSPVWLLYLLRYPPLCCNNVWPRKETRDVGPVCMKRGQHCCSLWGWGLTAHSNSVLTEVTNTNAPPVDRHTDWCL